MSRFQTLSLIFLIALCFRLLFAFYLQYFLYGELVFKFGDTHSYTESFLNLYNHGNYTFAPSHPDASFFRTPMYPFFWGLHYILFGESLVFHAIAVSQSVFDSLSCILIYYIISQLVGRYIYAVIGSIIYAFNPFQIIWIPITATETLATFMSLTLVLYALYLDTTWLKAFLCGVLIGLAVYLRQYLGIYLVLIPVFLAFNYYSRPYELIKSVSLIVLGFSITLSPWVARNWINHGTPYILMGETRGYYNYGPDAAAFDNLMNKLDENITPYFEDAAKTGSVDLDEFNLDPDVQKLIEEGVTLAHDCGLSFQEARNERTESFPERDKECEDEIIKTLEEAKNRYRDSVGFLRYHKTKFDALMKAFFKFSLVDGDIDNMLINVLMKLAFALRSMIIIFGFIGLFWVTRKTAIVPLFPLFMYIFVTTVLIHTEMRYLLQADAILLCLCMLALSRIHYHVSRIRADHRDSTIEG